MIQYGSTAVIFVARTGTGGRFSGLHTDKDNLDKIDDNLDKIDKVVNVRWA